MITIAYKHKRFFINAKLLGKAFKDLAVKLLTALAVIDGIGGALLLLGTAGSSDLNTIGLTEIILRTLCGIILFGVSYTSCFVRNSIR